MELNVFDIKKIVEDSIDKKLNENEMEKLFRNYQLKIDCYYDNNREKSEDKITREKIKLILMRNEKLFMKNILSEFKDEKELKLLYRGFNLLQEKNTKYNCVINKSLYMFKSYSIYLNNKLKKILSIDELLPFMLTNCNKLELSDKRILGISIIKSIKSQTNSAPHFEFYLKHRIYDNIEDIKEIENEIFENISYEDVLDYLENSIIRG